jgi:hypothetical protein
VPGKGIVKIEDSESMAGKYRMIKISLACQKNVGGIIHVSYLGSETLLFKVALFNN